MLRSTSFVLSILLFAFTLGCERDPVGSLGDGASQGIEYRSVESIELLVNDIASDSIFFEFVRIQNLLTQKFLTEFETLDTSSISELDQKMGTWAIGDTLSVDDVVFIRNLLNYSVLEFDTLLLQLGNITLDMKEKYAATFAQLSENQVDSLFAIWADQSMHLFYLPGITDSLSFDEILEFRWDNCCGFSPLCSAQERCISQACAAYYDRVNDAIGVGLGIWGTHIAVAGGVGAAFGIWAAGPPGALAGGIEFGSLGIASGAIHSTIYFGRRLTQIRQFRTADCEHCSQQVECDE